MARQTEASKDRALPPEVALAVELWEQRNGIGVEQAKLALRTLFWEGCDPVTVLEIVQRYCSPTRDLIRTRQKSLQQFKERVVRLARSLHNTARELREIDKHIQLADELPYRMVEFAEYLERMYSWELDQTVLSRGGGLQILLLSAALLIQMATGHRHYQELTDLVNTIRRSPDLIDTDAVRKTITRCEQRGTTFIVWTRKELEQMAKQGCKKWHAFRSCYKCRKVTCSGCNDSNCPCGDSPPHLPTPPMHLRTYPEN